MWKFSKSYLGEMTLFEQHFNMLGKSRSRENVSLCVSGKSIIETGGCGLWNNCCR